MLRNRRKGFIGLLIVAALHGLAVLPAQAVPVTTTVNGTVDLAEPTNPFGLSVGDGITAVAMYENSLVPASGPFELAIDSNPAFSFAITLATTTFIETDDTDFGTGFPSLVFTDGALSGIDFEIDGFSLGNFPDLVLGSIDGLTEFFLDDNLTNAVLLEGTWDFSNAQTVPVDTNPIPEPSTLLLLGTGMIGLVIRRWISRKPHE